MTRYGTAEPFSSRDYILTRERRLGNNIHFPFPAYHEQDWQPCSSVDPDSAECDDHTYIDTYSVPGCTFGHTI